MKNIKMNKVKKKNKPLTVISGTKVKANSERDYLNKVLIIGILSVISITILLRVITSVLLDLGFYEGEIHQSFWKEGWIVNQIGDSGKSRVALDKMRQLYPGESLSLIKELSLRSGNHPNFFWTLTQFTWQTTILIFFIFLFRILLYSGTQSKGLKWINKHSTLSLLSIYDTVVCVVFWSALYKNGVSSGFSNDNAIYCLELTVTILVHAVVPLLVVCYALLYLLVGRTAKRMNYNVLFIGAIYPIAYLIFYIIMSFIWTDPYPVTNLTRMWKDKDFSSVWTICVALISIFIFMALSFVLHNFLLKFNKYKSDKYVQK